MPAAAWRRLPIFMLMVACCLSAGATVMTAPADGEIMDPLTGEADLEIGLGAPDGLIDLKEGASMLAEADSAYMKGDFERAVTLYKELAGSYPSDAGLLVNLGNACYKSGDEGEARLFLERAKRLDPSDKTIDQNLAYLASRIQDANKAELKGKKGNVAPDEIGYFGRMRKRIAVDTSSNAWAEMGASAFVLMILSLVLYFFSSQVKFRKIGFFSALIFLFFLVVFVGFSKMAANHFESEDEGIVTVFKARLTDEPDPSANTVGFPLHRGTKLEILESSLNAQGETGWYKVRLNHSNTGWIEASALTII